MRIAFFTDAFDLSGTEELAARKFVLALEDIGHEVDWHARAPLQRVLPSGSALRFFHFPSAFGSIMSHLHVLTEEVDIIHIDGALSFFWLALYRCFKRQARLIVRVADDYEPSSVALWFLKRLPHAVVVSSHASLKRLQPVLAETVQCAPRATRAQATRDDDVVRSLGLRKKKYLLGFASEGEQSGLHYLLQAFHGLASPDLQLALSGTGSLPTNYRRYLEEFAAGDPRIIFIDRSDDEAVKQLCSHAWCVVFPTETVGVRSEIFLAMGCGTPVLVSDIPENAAAISYHGFRFPAANIAELREKIAWMLQEKDAVRDVGKGAREYVAESLDSSALAEETARLYERLRLV